jgi:acid phosphatase type 7
MTVRTRMGRALLAIAGLVVVAILAFAWSGGAPDRGAPDPSSPAPSIPMRTTGATGVAGTGPAASEPPSATAGSPIEPSPSVIPVLVGAGDIADCSEDGDTATADLLETIQGTVFTLGDNAYEDGTTAQFQECYGPTWGRPSIKDRTKPVVGNHEYHTRGAQGYFRYFGAAAGEPGQGWYAYDAGAWRIYVLNSNCGEVGGCQAGSAQERWLRADLAANPRACVLAMSHHPRFSSGEHGDTHDIADLWQTLQHAGAELLLSGHDHSYERFAAQDGSGTRDEDGLVQFVVGTGGRAAYPFRETEPNSIVRGTPVLGVLRLELRPDAYAFEFLAVPGDDFSDAGTGPCH